MYEIASEHQWRSTQDGSGTLISAGPRSIRGAALGLPDRDTQAPQADEKGCQEGPEPDHGVGTTQIRNEEQQHQEADEGQCGAGYGDANGVDLPRWRRGT